MQSQLESTVYAPAAKVANGTLAELWRGAWVIFRKHLHKFRSDRQPPA